MAKGRSITHLESQGSDDLADLPLQIPISAVYEHFQCPICMTTMEKACVTTCGHRFCHGCIDECINRRHQCPCCKKELHRDQVIADHSFDAIIRTVKEEKNKAEKRYYQELVEAATNAPFSKEPSSTDSPLEAVLKKHLKHTLNMHETFHQQLIVDYRRGLGKLSQEKQLKTERIMRNFPHNPNHPECVSQLAEIKKKGEERKQLLAGELERVEKLLTAAYDRYLAEYLPSPSTVPIAISLSVPEKQFSAPEVILQPDDSMAVVLEKLRSAMEGKGFAVAEFPACEEFTVSFISPFTTDVDSGESQCMENGSSNSHDNSDKGGDEDKGKNQVNLLDQVLNADCRPVLEFALKPGTELRFKGHIVLEGETPTLCFAASFSKSHSRSIDYFTCRECGFNWVCQPCAEICHKGHTLVPYVRNHKPTWACCYCPKKKMCTIQKPSS